MRNLTYEDYNTWQRRIRNDYEDCRLIIRIFLRENDYSFIKIFPVWKDEERITPSIKIPYLSWNKGLLMSEFIEPFLVALSQFLTEEERGKLPPPWREREEEEKEKGKRKRKKDDKTEAGRFEVCLEGKMNPIFFLVLGKEKNKKKKEKQGGVIWKFVPPSSPP